MMEIKIRDYEPQDFKTVVGQYKKMPKFFTNRALKIIQNNLKNVENKEQEYDCIVATIEDQIVGNLIFNKDITGDLVYEFKWLATDYTMKYRPFIFKKLMQAGEEKIKEKARLFILYTSNTANEKNTQSMFLKLGYTKVAVVPNFWDEGDDRVIFMKRNPYYILKKEISMEEELKKLLGKQNSDQVKNFLYQKQAEFKNYNQEVKIPLGAGVDGYNFLMDSIGIRENTNPIQTNIEGQSPVMFVNYYPSEIPNLYLVRKERFDELDNDNMECELLFSNEIKPEEL